MGNIERGNIERLCGWGILKGCVDGESWPSFSFPKQSLEKPNVLSFHPFIISLLHLASMFNSSLFVHVYYLTFPYHLCYLFYHFHFSLLLEPFMSEFIKPQPVTV